MTDTATLPDVVSSFVSAGQKQDPILSLITRIIESYSHSLCVYPVLCLVLVGIIAFGTRHRWWLNYVDSHAFRARFILFFVMIALAATLVGTSKWAVYQIKGEVSLGFPVVVTTAIKLGVYQLELHQQLATRVPADQKDLFACVKALGMAEGENSLGACTTVPACVQPIPPTPKQQIIKEITDIQSGRVAIDEKLQACRRVKLQMFSASPTE